MKKLLALLLVLAMAFSLMACGASDDAADTTAAAGNTTAANDAADDADDTDAADTSAILTEEEAAAARDAGTLVGDAYAGYDYSDSTGLWYYSNYPNYKDFNADGKIKVAFVCKFSGSWFTPKAESLGETVKAAGYEYLYIDANSDEQQWLDGVQSIINQDFDVVVLTPVNTALLPDAIAMLQEAGVAYLTTDDPGQDVNGFYVPHYGLDDKYLFYEAGKVLAQKADDEGFFDDVAEDYSNFKMVIMDSPSVEAIHNRNVAFEQAILEAYPDMPSDAILWLDCAGGLTDDVSTKLSSTLQTYIDSTDKWIFASGTGSGVGGSFTLLRENGFEAEDFLFCETIADMVVANELKSDYGASCVLVGLASAPSGVGMGNLIIDLVENGTPIPCFTGYELIVVNNENVDDFVDKYLS